MEIERKHLIRRAVLCFILLGFFVWLLWWCVVTGDPCGLLLFSIIGTAVSLVGVLWNAPFSRPALQRWKARSDRQNLLGTETAKLGENDLFPDDDTRVRAIREVERQMGNDWAYFATTLAFTVLGGGLLVLVTTGAISTSRVVQVVFLVPVVVAVGLGEELRRILFKHRRERLLRERLLALGVPVCLACGYDLRALTEPRCPECGAAFDPKLLAANSTPART